MLSVAKSYVDSRFKSSDSASPSNLKVDLPQNFPMPEDAGFYIDDVCIPPSWYLVETGRNIRIVMAYDGMIHFVTIDPGNYAVKDLGVAIVDAINNK